MGRAFAGRAYRILGADDLAGPRVEFQAARLLLAADGYLERTRSLTADGMVGARACSMPRVAPM